MSKTKVNLNTIIDATARYFCVLYNDRKEHFTYLAVLYPVLLEYYYINIIYYIIIYCIIMLLEYNINNIIRILFSLHYLSKLKSNVE